MAGAVGRTSDDERARAAWLLAVDLADEQAKIGFARIITMPGKAGRGSPADVSRARQLALYLATTVADVTCRPLAKAAGIHPSTVSHHVEALADERDENPDLDRLLTELEERMVWRAASLVMARLRYGHGDAA